MRAHQFCYETVFRLYKAANKVKTEDDGGYRAHLHNATILLLVTVHDNQLYSIAKGDILLQTCIIRLCREGMGGGGGGRGYYGTSVIQCTHAKWFRKYSRLVSCSKLCFEIKNYDSLPGPLSISTYMYMYCTAVHR